MPHTSDRWSAAIALNVWASDATVTSLVSTPVRGEDTRWLPALHASPWGTSLASATLTHFQTFIGVGGPDWICPTYLQLSCFACNARMCAHVTYGLVHEWARPPCDFEMELP